MASERENIDRSSPSTAQQPKKMATASPENLEVGLWLTMVFVAAASCRMAQLVDIAPVSIPERLLELFTVGGTPKSTAIEEREIDRSNTRLE